MKLVMTLLARNEADMVEANLDYHLAQGVDFIIVTDHGSSDGTGERLQPYVEAGVARVIREEGEQHHQSRRVTRMARLALTEHGADWVFHNDADEFWWPLSGSLRDVFAAIPPAYGQVAVPRHNFRPTPDDSGPFYCRLVYRDPRSLNPSDCPLEPKIAHRAHPDVVVAPGNHSISGTDVPAAPAGELIEIFHFPMRSFEQFERKVIQTGIGYETLDDRSPGVGRDQLKLLEMYRAGGLQAYYEAAVVDDKARERGLESGSLVLDRRLESFMRTLPEQPRNGGRPDGPATRAFIAKALNAMSDLHATEQALAVVQAHAAALTRDLSSIEADLHTLQTSRLMRWSAPARRVWYRVR